MKIQPSLHFRKRRETPDKSSARPQKPDKPDKL